MTRKFTLVRRGDTNSEKSRPGFSRQNILELTRQAIAAAQSQALRSDTVIILETKPSNANVFANAEQFLGAMAVLLSDATRQAPEKSAISVRILVRGLQIMIALEGQGDGLDRQTINSISDGFDQVTWPDSHDPTDVTIPSNKAGIDQTALHIRRLAAVEQYRGQQIAGDDKATVRAILTYPKITFH